MPNVVPRRSKQGIGMLQAAGLALVMGLSACAVQPVALRSAATVVPIPPGAARLWFYREYEPSVSLNNANVELNGQPAASVSADGSALYRDVPPGHYHITVDSYGRDVNQAKDIDLAAGQEGFVKILASESWESGGDLTQFKRDTFYVSLVPPQIARTELPTHPLSGG